MRLLRGVQMSGNSIHLKYNPGLIVRLVYAWGAVLSKGGGTWVVSLAGRAALYSALSR
ncbi:MAG: hypothetical protein ACI9W6_002246 [Motiliproteus sp.]|jgi:hypothetical protein